MTRDEIERREEAIDAPEAAKLFGLCKDRFMRNQASQPSFPARVNYRPAAWIRGEVLDWRENHRAEKRRRA